MKTYLTFLILLFIFAACKENQPDLEGDIKVSKIENKEILEAPLILEQGLTNDVIINGESISFNRGIFELSDAGFYEMVLNENDTVLFVLLNPERIYDGRVFPEWGLKEWIPRLPVITENYSNRINVVYPKKYIPTITIPFILMIDDWNTNNNVNLACKVDSEIDFMMKRGIGSISKIIGNEKVNFTVGNQSLSVSLIENESTKKELEGIISNEYIIAKNEIIYIKNDLTINHSGSLIVNEGAIIIIDEGVNITNNGPIEFNGTSENPILVTCSDPESYFGGFISNGSNALINGRYTFFSRFSFHSSDDYKYGHAQHQALFKSTSTQQHFDHCYFFDSPGQVFYPREVDLSLSNLIIQRTKTTGQLNGGEVSINNCYFSDFPNDSQVYQDEDNDAIYLNDIDANISNSIFMYTKDDGIDSGGDKGGTINISNCIFEACFHEGIAMSSVDPAIKKHNIQNCYFSNCQQGVELGFSSPNHEVIVNECTVTGNYIGVRFGDCYERPVDGMVTVKNTEIFDNIKNTWNMLRRNWSPSPNRLIFENTTFD